MIGELQVKNKEFIESASKFLSTNADLSENAYMEYMKRSYPNRRWKGENKKDATKAYYLAKKLKLKDELLNVDLTKQNEAIDQFDKKIVQNKVKKRAYPEENELVNERDSKKAKLTNNLSEKKIEKYFWLDPLDSLEEISILPFNDYLTTTFANYLMDASTGKLCRLAISGRRRCGKSTFIKQTAMNFGFTYFEVDEFFVQRFSSKEFWVSVKALSSKYVKVLFHFDLSESNRKVLGNFLLRSNYSKNTVIIIECQDSKSLSRCYDAKIQWPKTEKLERSRFIEHFMKECLVKSGVTSDEVASWTAGYEIGDVEKLAFVVRNESNNVTKDQLLSLIRKHRESVVDTSLFIYENDVSWQDVGGHEALIDKLEKIIKELMDDKCIVNGVLLYGPPGTGKTMIAKVLSQKHELPFINVKCEDILCSLQGESEKKVKDIFDHARSCQPCILFIDEIDTLCSRRSDDNSASRNSIVTTFLTNLNGIGTDKQRVLVIGATNFKENIDDAIMRSGRMGTHIEVPIPKSQEDRLSVLMAASRKEKFKSNDSAKEILEELSKDVYTESLSQADLSCLIKEMVTIHKTSSNNEFITIEDGLQAYASIKDASIRKQAFMTKFFDQSTIVKVDELESIVKTSFPYSDVLMKNASELLEDIEQQPCVSFISINGLKSSGKTNYIFTVARNWKFNVVSLKKCFFSNFNEREFWKQIFYFANAFGNTIIHIDNVGVPMDVISKIEDSSFSKSMNKDIVVIFYELVSDTIPEAPFFVNINSSTCCKTLIEKYSLPVDEEFLLSKTKGWTMDRYFRLDNSLRLCNRTITADLLSAKIGMNNNYNYI